LELDIAQLVAANAVFANNGQHNTIANAMKNRLVVNMYSPFSLA
jgi:hypothetical protein